jgi:hypothetical protein
MACKNALRANKKLAWTAGQAVGLWIVRATAVSGWPRNIYCENGNFLQQNFRARHLLFLLADSMRFYGRFSRSRP